jgi:hypothetical protein
MTECLGTQWISVAMLRARRLRALLMNHLASHCPGTDLRCAAGQIAACKLLKTATIFTQSFYNDYLFSIATSSASPTSHRLPSKTSMHPMPRKLQRDLHSFPCLPTPVAPTRPSFERDPSVHHIQNPAPIVASFSLAQCCAAHLAAVVSSVDTRR